MVNILSLFAAAASPAVITQKSWQEMRWRKTKKKKKKQKNHIYWKKTKKNEEDGRRVISLISHRRLLDKRAVCDAGYKTTLSISLLKLNQWKKNQHQSYHESLWKTENCLRLCNWKEKHRESTRSNVSLCVAFKMETLKRSVHFDPWSILDPAYDGRIFLEFPAFCGFFLYWTFTTACSPPVYSRA